MILTEEQIIQKYRMTADFHTHTCHSTTGPVKHAFGTVAENVRTAHRLGIRELAITDHGPGHFIYGVGTDHVPALRKEIEDAMELYPDVKVYLGVEANFKDTPNGLDVSPEEFELYDFVNAGYHYGVMDSCMQENWLAHKKLPVPGGIDKLRDFNTELVVRALENNKIKVLTHPGDKGPFDLHAICRACEKSGTLLEINAKHKHLTVEEIGLAAHYDVSFIVGSDAHRAENVGTYAPTVRRAMEAGLDLSRIVNIEER
ncbi:MAG: PHP domain-containing protein [Firmicutes bacterium]|nr:PHP domain-containing protein [Bacillota bacterium]